MDASFSRPPVEMTQRLIVHYKWTEMKGRRRWRLASGHTRDRSMKKVQTLLFLLSLLAYFSFFHLSSSFGFSLQSWVYHPCDNTDSTMSLGSKIHLYNSECPSLPSLEPHRPNLAPKTEAPPLTSAQTLGPEPIHVMGVNPQKLLVQGFVD